MATVSARFVRAPDLDIAIEAALADIGGQSKADRAFTFVISADGDSISNAHEWCAEGVGHQKENLQDMPTAKFPWLMEKLNRGDVVRIDSVSALPAEALAERREFEREDKRSLLVLPFHIGGKLAGFIGIDNVTEVKHWSREDQALLIITADIIGNALEKQRSVEILGDSEQRYRAIIDTANDAMITIDAAGTIVSWNGAAELQFGFTAMETVGKNISLVIPAHYRERHRKGLARLAVTGESHLVGKTLEMAGLRKDGSEFPIELSVSGWVSSKGRFYTAAIRDISERKSKEELIEHLAFNDPLTDLPNRRLFLDFAAKALKSAKRHKDLLAVVFLDLDGFKNVNDTFGHRSGDVLLRGVAHRLLANLRGSDMLGRLGGDEFGVVLPRIAAGGDAGAICGKLVAAITAEPFHDEKHEFHSSASCGISLFPFDGSTLDDMMAAADIAMYRAKSGGGNTYEYFEKDVGEAS